MIACPELDDLAELASLPGGARAEVADHAASCESCRALVEDQRAIRRLAQALPAPPPLSPARREALAAATLALADREPARELRDELAARREMHDADEPPPSTSGRARWIVAGAAAAVLVAVALAALLAPRTTLTDDAVAYVEVPPPAIAAVPVPEPALAHELRERVAVAPSPSAAEPVLARVDAAHARIDRVREGATEVIRLHEGTVTVDARGASPVAVATSETRVGVGSAVAAIAAKNGAIVTVTVVAGSVEVVDRGRTFIVAAGDIWERDASADASFTAFRDGWTLLRAGSDREAIAAFDRATHRDIAEDAAYWAAVASERAGDKPGAVRRFEDFLARFPRSPRADGARGALERLR